MGELVGEKANLSHLSGFLTFLAPHVHRDAHYKEDEPKHKAKDSSQHLSPGRIRLSLGRTDPTVSLISTCHTRLRLLSESLEPDAEYQHEDSER